MTILLKPDCHDLRNVGGAEFWLENPLPKGAADFKNEWTYPPTAAGTFYRTTFLRRCTRVLLCEGAQHDGSTYTTLGTISTWQIAKASPPGGDRPEWMRGERETARWSAPFDPTEKYSRQGRWSDRRPMLPEIDPAGILAWVNGGSYTFTVDDATGRQRIFDALIEPQPHGLGTALADDADLMDTTVRVSGTDPDTIARHSADGFAQAPALLVRLGSDATIYRLTNMAWSSGAWTASIAPAVRVAQVSGAAVTYLRGIPMPPGIPHDLLLQAVVYKWVRKSRVAELVPDSDPAEYQWAGDSEIAESGNAGTKIRPRLFYWGCEPRGYYA